MALTSNITRRRILRGVAIGTAGGIGLAASASGAAARSGQGGSGVVADDTWDAHAEDRFKIIDRVGFQTFACRGQPREWACYRIEFEDAPGVQHNLYLNPERRVDTQAGSYPTGRGYEDGDRYMGWHEFTGQGHECRHYDGGMTVAGDPKDAAVKVSFKPAKGS